MTPPAAAIRLSNPMRYIVPIGTALLALLMFIPPLAFATIGGGKMIVGIAILILSVLWLLRSAWRAPFEMTIEPAGVAVRRWSGERRYEAGRVRKWWFAIPDGKPTNTPPATNGVLYVVLDDRTRFRAEVTAEEARDLARLLPAT